MRYQHTMVYGRRYRVNKRRFISFLILIVILATATIYFVFPRIPGQYMVSDFTASELEVYFNIEREKGIPWYYIAAVDRAQGLSPSYVTAERATKIAGYLEGIRDESQIKELVSAYINDKKFIKKVYRELDRLKYINRVYSNKIFPVAYGYEYTYSNDFGAKRTYGGDRKHEGIDIMCDRGVPLLAVCDGVVEKKGWLELGGYRLGIRGDDGIYYYYAHLSKYAAGIEEGVRIKKGQLIGYAGDTGYGEEGTSGRFPPHLHFGMYEKGRAVNPYPFLKAWEDRKVYLFDFEDQKEEVYSDDKRQGKKRY